MPKAGPVLVSALNELPVKLGSTAELAVHKANAEVTSTLRQEAAACPSQLTCYASTPRRHRSISLYETPCLSLSTEIVSVMMVFSQSAGLMTKSA